MEEIVEMEIIIMEIIMVGIQITMAAIPTTAVIQQDQRIDRTIMEDILVTEMEDIQTIIMGIQTTMEGIQTIMVAIQVMAMVDIQAMVMEDTQITTIIMDTLETASALREVIKSKMNL